MADDETMAGEGLNSMKLVAAIDDLNNEANDLKTRRYLLNQMISIFESPQAGSDRDLLVETFKNTVELPYSGRT